MSTLRVLRQKIPPRFERDFLFASHLQFLYIFGEMRRIYLDHTATTPVDPRVLEAMTPFFLDTFGNASSVHRFGQYARAALDESRGAIARAIGAKEGEIFFTGSGTEADNFALKGTARAMRKRGKTHVVTGKSEHLAVLESCSFLESEDFSVSYVDVDEYGMVHPDTVRGVLRKETGLISIMHVNNEVGTVNPVHEIARIGKERGILVHTDAVQSFCKIPLHVDELGVDLLTISAHKIHGPKGIGALYIRKGVETEKFLHGGGQERGKRAGTEAVPLAVGFARACELMLGDMESEKIRMTDLKNEFRSMLTDRFPFLIINGHPTDSLPNILNVSFDSAGVSIDGDVLLLNLDLAGIAATSGSACTSGNMEPSHVLLAMGRDEATARATMRFSFGRSTTKEDLAYTVERLEEIVQRLVKVHA
jgi:cysteine desulfurase